MKWIACIAALITAVLALVAALNSTGWVQWIWAGQVPIWLFTSYMWFDMTRGH